MQEPGSPEVKKPAFGDDSKEYAQLISYSIVFEHKSTVWGFQSEAPFFLRVKIEGFLVLAQQH